MAASVAIHKLKMNTIKKIKEISAIRSGYTFRKGIEEVPDGQIQVVQIKDISENGKLSINDLIRTNLPEMRGDYFINKGDVLFVSRGAKKQAIAIKTELENTIVGYQFFILTPKNTVISEYLAYFLNQKSAQRYIEEHSAGSNVTIITKEFFGNLEVIVPPLEIQEKIVKISELAGKETELLNSIKEKREKLVEALLQKIIQSEITDRR